MSETTPHIQAEELAAYLEGQVSSDERTRIEEHLASCVECRTEAVGAFRSLRRERGSPFSWRPLALVAAALVVLVIGGDRLLERSRGESGPPFRATPGADFEQVGTLEIVGPTEGRPMTGRDVLFVWRPGPEGSFYRLTLTDEAGDVLWRISTSDTIAAPGGDVQLRPGEAYFWIVDALAGGGRTATSGAHRFTVARDP